MQSTEDWVSNDLALPKRFNGSGKWSVVVKRLMRTSRVVIVGVFGEDPNQVYLVENDDMIETIAAD